MSYLRTIVALLLCLLAAPCWADITDAALHVTFNTNGNDVTANARHMTAVGTPVHTAGKIGNGAIGVNATNYYTLANPTWLNGDATYTIACWARKSSFVTNTAAISWGDANIGTGVLILYPYDAFNGNGVRGYTRSLTPWDRNDSLPPINEWCFFCQRVLSTSSAKLDTYVPSNTTWRQNTTAVNCACPATMTELRVGNLHTSGAQGFDGDVDELWVFTRDVSDAEVIELMNWSPTFRPITSSLPGISVVDRMRGSIP
jgi:hypothetical protein